MHVSAIIAAAGRGSRYGGTHRKQLLALGGIPLLQRSVGVFLETPIVDDLVVALPDDLVAHPPPYLTHRSKPIALVAGGGRRQDSVANALARVADRADVVVVHDAARPLVTRDVIVRTIEAAAEVGAAVAAIPTRDTVKRADASGRVRETLPREEIYLAQTPQAFRTAVLQHALSLGIDATDEAMLVERAGGAVRLVEGDPVNIKITTPNDLAVAERLLGGANAASLRIGNGYDLHRLAPGRPLKLGGVGIPFDRGLHGHSDADVVCHAVTDALLGAAGAGDIGRHFPDSDAAWKGADSLDLLRRAAAIVAAAGYAVVNVDVVVIAERPKIAPYVDAMRARLAEAIGSDSSQVSVKGKTNEGADSMGAGESIAAHAVALLTRV